MIGEQKAKALFAGGIALFVTGLVVLMLFVIPAAQHSQVAVAQEELPPEPPGAEPPPGEMAPGEMPPGMEMPGGAGYPGPGAGMPGEMPAGGGGGGGVGAGTVISGAPPLEPSRPNPFAPRSAAAVAEAEAVAATTYGPDWSRLPIAERVAFVTPEIPPAPTPPLPPMQAPPEKQIRVTSILWDASGQAQAAYEDPEGETGVLRPGDRINGFTVTSISRRGVTLHNQGTGETQQLELRPRAERREEPRTRRPSARGGQQTGGEQPGGRRRPTRQQGGTRQPRPEFPVAPQ